MGLFHIFLNKGVLEMSVKIEGFLQTLLFY